MVPVDSIHHFHLVDYSLLWSMHVMMMMMMMMHVMV